MKSLTLKAVELARKNIKLMESKDRDYNQGPIDQREYYIYGDKSIINEVWKKVLRIRSLAERTDGTEANHEGLKDNALDLANYALILAVWYEEHEDANANR